MQVEILQANGGIFRSLLLLLSSLYVVSGILSKWCSRWVCHARYGAERHRLYSRINYTKVDRINRHYVGTQSLKLRWSKGAGKRERKRERSERVFCVLYEMMNWQNALFGYIRAYRMRWERNIMTDESTILMKPVTHAHTRTSHTRHFCW